MLLISALFIKFKCSKKKSNFEKKNRITIQIKEQLNKQINLTSF
jgi:hypothetical protein